MPVDVDAIERQIREGMDHGLSLQPAVVAALMTCRALFRSFTAPAVVGAMAGVRAVPRGRYSTPWQS